MGATLRKSAAALLLIASAMTGASAHALGASNDITLAGPETWPQYAIALATAGFLVVLLLLLRMSRVRRRDRARRDESGDPAGVERRDVTMPLATASPTTPPAEAHLPRWRRPSVVAARFGLAGSSAGRPNRLAFAADPVADDATVERMVIRYDAVPMVEEPDDVHGRVVDELGAGDEVEVVGRETVWVQVLTPAGRTGWVPAMTLASLEELPAAAWAASEPVAEPEVEIADAPPLEALLEAIAAQRRTLAVAAAELESTPPDPEPRPKRARTARAAATSQPSSRRKTAASES